MKINKLYILTFCFLGISCIGLSQRFLQLEFANVAETMKFSEGDKITICTKFIPEWHRVEIEQLMPDDNVILHENGFLHLEDITKIRLHKALPKNIGNALKTFGTVYLSFGGTAYLLDKFDFGWDTLAIGLASYIVGWVIKKFAGKKDHSLGDRIRLRILDLRFPTPEELAPELRSPIPE